MAGTGFDASKFAPSLGLMSKLGKFAGGLGQGGFQPDLSAATATQQSMSRLPMMSAGGGMLANPTSVTANLGGMMNPVRAQALTQQAGEYDQYHQQLSDFLLSTGMDHDSIQAMITRLKTMQMQSNTGASQGVLGGLF